MNKVARAQNKNFFIGENLALRDFLFLNGKIVIIRIAIRRATTPPSLLGIDRRIAYANRKYHSG